MFDWVPNTPPPCNEVMVIISLWVIRKTRWFSMDSFSLHIKKLLQFNQLIAVNCEGDRRTFLSIIVFCF